jgi:hypothetical protein
MTSLRVDELRCGAGQGEQGRSGHDGVGDGLDERFS